MYMLQLASDRLLQIAEDIKMVCHQIVEDSQTKRLSHIMTSGTTYHMVAAAYL